MPTSLERRIDALESLRRDNRPAVEMSDRELLEIIAPGFIGPMPSDDELQVLIAARLKSIPAQGDDHGES